VTERIQPQGGDSGPSSEGARFVCLGYGFEKTSKATSPSELEALTEECMAYDAVIRKYGAALGGIALQSAGTAKTLRSGGGKVLVTDGPYAETKEQLGGVAINKFTDIDRAVEAWSNHPCLRKGGVLEIRPADEDFNARVAAREVLAAEH
jgi:hypothetical protein